MNRNTAARILLLCMPIGACAASHTTDIANKSIWVLIENVARAMPLSRDSFETALDSHLGLTQRDEHKTQWVGGRIPLTDGMEVVSTTLVLGPSDKFDSTSGASIYFEGGCIGLSELQLRYGKVVMTDSPRSPSPQEETVYRSKQEWGNLVFVFQERRPTCLAYVTFRGSKD